MTRWTEMLEEINELKDRQSYSDALARMAQLFELTKALPSSVSANLFALVYGRYGELYLRLGDLEQSRKFNELALHSAAESSDGDVISIYIRNIFEIAKLSKNYQETEKWAGIHTAISQERALIPKQQSGNSAWLKHERPKAIGLKLQKPSSDLSAEPKSLFGPINSVFRYFSTTAPNCIVVTKHLTSLAVFTKKRSNCGVRPANETLSLPNFFTTLLSYTRKVPTLNVQRRCFCNRSQSKELY